MISLERMVEIAQEAGLSVPDRAELQRRYQMSARDRIRNMLKTLGPLTKPDAQELCGIDTYPLFSQLYDLERELSFRLDTKESAGPVNEGPVVW